MCVRACAVEHTMQAYLCIRIIWLALTGGTMNEEMLKLKGNVLLSVLTKLDEM